MTGEEQESDIELLYIITFRSKSPQDRDTHTRFIVPGCCFYAFGVCLHLFLRTTHCVYTHTHKHSAFAAEGDLSLWLTQPRAASSCFALSIFKIIYSGI